MTSDPDARIVALVRAVSPRISECELGHLDREPIDFVIAAQQHLQYEQWLSAQGCQLLQLEETPEMPDGVFVEDTAVVLGEVAVITRPGAESRRPETESMERVLARFRIVERIVAPGTIDGGDVLQFGRRLYVGRSQRSNDAGIRQLTDLVVRHGYGVIPVQFTGCLHLKSAISLVAPDTVLVNPDWVEPSLFAIRNIVVAPEEPAAANALLIGERALVAAEHPRTREILERNGIEADAIAVSELLKAEAGMTCCSVLVMPAS